MNVKSQIVILCLVICILMSVCTVSANDVNDTYLAVEDSVIDENITIDESQELLQVNENEDMLSAGDGSFTELQNLINENSGTLTLEKNYVFNDGENPISIDKSITIIGNGHKIDGAGKSSILKITGDDVTLKNIEFSNGYILSERIIQYGAAIYWMGKNGVVDTCTFSNNIINTTRYVNSLGGAIFWTGKNATVKDSTFKNNSILGTSGSGGAIYFDIQCENAYVNNSQFISNNAYKEGGAIYILNVKSEIINSIFKNNYAKSAGGAIYYQNNIPNEGVVISECNFVNNIADTGVYGSAIFADSINSTIYKCNFDGVNPIRLESTPDSGCINISSNIENSNLAKSHIIYNNAKLWLENNEFKTSIYNEGLILSHVYSYVLDSSHSYGNTYYEWNAIDKFLYKVTILDDKDNKIVNKEITVLDTKEGLINTDNNFTYCNFNSSYMWFVGVHILSAIWDKKYFADMDNRTTTYRVSGSYAHLQYFNWAYSDSKNKGSWDYDGGDVILEGHIEYSPTFDTSSVAIEKMKSIRQKDDFINGVEIEISFKGSLWNNGKKVKISGNDSALGIRIGSDDVYIENIQFNDHFASNANDHGISVYSYYDNVTINNCKFTGTNQYNKTSASFTGINTAYDAYNIFEGIYIYAVSNDFSIMNCEFGFNHNDNASCIDLKGNNVKIINNTFSDSFMLEIGDRTYEVYSESVGGCLIFADNSKNYLLENNTFGCTEDILDSFDEYGLIFRNMDNLTIKNMKIKNIIDKSFLTIYNSENIYIDHLNITADDMNFYRSIQSLGIGYRCIPEALVVIGLYGSDKASIENLTIVNSEFSKSYTTCLYIKENTVQNAVININMSNIYCHDNNRLHPAYFNEPDLAGADVYYYDHNFTVSDPDVFLSVDSVVNMDNSRFERLTNGVAVWAAGALTVNNCSFIENTGFFTGYDQRIILSGVYEYEDIKEWYGENGAAIAASNYLAVYNSTFINNTNPYMSSLMGGELGVAGLTNNISSLNAGGGAISYRPYTGKGKWPLSNGVSGTSTGMFWHAFNTVDREYISKPSTGWWGIIDNCTFINNEANNGGAIQTFTSYNNTTIIDCRFINNKACNQDPGEHKSVLYLEKKDQGGGPISAEVVDFTINNRASGFGGAIFVRGSNDSGTFIYNSTFDKNEAEFAGGAIGSHTYLSGDYDKSFLIINDSHFTNNSNSLIRGEITWASDFNSLGELVSMPYREIIYDCLPVTNITNNIFDNYEVTSLTVRSSGNVFVANNTEVNNKTNKKFDKFDPVYSAVLINGYTVLENNSFNNTILYVENPGINSHSFASPVHIIYMDGRDHYINETTENLKLYATITDDNNNTLVTDSGFLFTDNYRYIHLHTPIFEVENFGIYYERNITKDLCQWNYTHSFFIIPKYINPDITPIYKFDNQTYLTKYIANNRTVNITNWVWESPVDSDYRTYVYGTIHDFLNFTQTKGRLISNIYGYTFLQSLIDDFNSTKVGTHILNVTRDIKFLQDFDMDINNMYYGKINFTHGVFVNSNSSDVWEINGQGHVISGINLARIFNITNATVILSNWKIQNGNMSNLTNTYGGAFYVSNSSVSIRNCTFMNHNATIGGAIYLNNSNLTFIDSSRDITTFKNNNAINGSVIYANNSNIFNNDAIYLNSNNATLGGALFLNNSNVSMINSAYIASHEDHAVNGSGIYAIGNLTNISGNFKFVSENSTAGAAIYAVNINNLNVSCEIFNVSATLDGGSIYAVNIPSVNISLKDLNAEFWYVKRVLILHYYEYYKYESFAKNGGLIYLDNVSGNVSVKGNEINRDYLNTYCHVYTRYHADDLGGCIFMNNSNINLINSDIHSFSYNKGGSIYSQNSNLTVIASVIQGSSVNYGGGIYAINSSVSLLNNSYVGQKDSITAETSVSRGPGNGHDYYERTYMVSIFGGAGLFIDNSTLFVSDATFENNYCWVNGSAIYVINSDNITILNSSFHRNLAMPSSLYFFNSIDLVLWNDEEGPKDVHVTSQESSKQMDYIRSVLRSYGLNSQQVDYSNNLSYGYGGGIYLENVTNFILNKTNFTTCSAAQDGGALYLKNVSNSVMNDNIFTDNKAVNGAAMALISCNKVFINSTNKFMAHHVSGNGSVIYSNNVGNLTISGVESKVINFINNSAKYGGAIFINNTNLTINYVLFNNNSASVDGGAIYMDTSSKNPVFMNIEAYNNHAILNGGVLFANNIGNITVKGKRNKFYNNTACYGGIFFVNASDNLIIYNSTFNESEAHYGGVIYINETTNTTISNSTFNENIVKFDGGAIYINKCDNLTIEDTEFIKNNARYGGAVYLNDPNLNITNSSFISNNATFGGAIFFNDSDSLNVIEDSNFTANNASAGGALYVNQTVGLNITNSLFDENNATIGGAIYYNDLNTFNSIKDSNFTDNAASIGGAIFVNETACLNITNSSFVGNNASLGAAIFFNGSDSLNVIEDSNFTANTASIGGALYVNATACLNVTNSLFDENNATLGGAIFYNDVANFYAIDDCNFTNNTASIGGALYVNQTLSLNITNSSFVGNNASLGAAIFYNDLDALNSIKNSNFTNNTASIGGALYVNATASLNVTNSSLWCFVC